MNEDTCVACGRYIPEGYGHVCTECLDKSKLRINANVRLPKPEPTQSVSHKTKTIQERMKSWRLINGLSVEKAASIAGCTNEAWRDWEAGAEVSFPWKKHIGKVIQNLV